MIYKKNVENDILAHTIIEGNYKGVNASNYFKMMVDPEIMAKGETPFKQLKVIEQESELTDIIYIEAELPPPMLTCDLLLKRTYFSIKDFPELGKELGLEGLKHNYYIVYQTSIDLPEFPVGKNRIETRISCWLIEENLEEDIMRFKAITSQKIHGITSPALVNKLGPQNAAIIFGRMLGNYFKQFGKTQPETKAQPEEKVQPEKAKP